MHRRRANARFGARCSGVFSYSLHEAKPRRTASGCAVLLIEDDGRPYGMAGALSAAAPIVTGIIALMFEVHPTLDALEVKPILHAGDRPERRVLQSETTATSPRRHRLHAAWGSEVKHELSFA